MSDSERKKTAPPMNLAPENAGIGSRLKGLLKSRLLRAGVSIAILAVLVWKINIGQSLSELAAARLWLVGLGFLIFIAASAVCTGKWQLILRTQGINASFPYLFSLFYIGFFFSNFLPTNFGGDVIKIMRLAKTSGRPADAAGSVVLDRASSTLALLLIAVVPALVRISHLGTATVALIIGMLVTALLTVFLMLHTPTARWLSSLPGLRMDPLGLRRHLRDFYFSLNRFGNHKGTLALILAISLFYQALQIIAIWLIARSLAIDLPFIYYFILIPILYAIIMVPVSLNGLGVREGAWVMLFTQAGTTGPQAFSMSILSLLVITAASLIGGIFYLFDRTQPVPRGETDHG